MFVCCEALSFPGMVRAEHEGGGSGVVVSELHELDQLDRRSPPNTATPPGLQASRSPHRGFTEAREAGQCRGTQSREKHQHASNLGRNASVEVLKVWTHPETYG
jgi:hypothetical protein